MLATGGTVLWSLAVGLLATEPSGAVVIALLLTVLLGQVLVVTGFVRMWTSARHDAALPLAAGEHPRSWLRAMSALVPAGVSAALGVACIALTFVLVIGDAAVHGGGDEHLSGAPAVLLLTGFMGVLGAFQNIALGTVTALLVRRSLVSRDRRALLESRELARSGSDVAATQRTTTPGREWRVLGRYAGVLGSGLGLLLLLTGRSYGLVLLLLPVAILLLRTWRGSRSPRIAALRDRLRQGAGLPPGNDDAPLLTARDAEVRAVALAHGWTPYAGRDRLAERLAGHLTGLRRDGWTGAVDGERFRLWDRVAYVLVSTNDRPTRTRITDASTTVDMEFPMVVRLAVVTDSLWSTVGWSWIGPRIDLESQEFNQRYDVYCDDPVRARLVLNPAVMAALLDVQDPAVLLLDEGRLTLTLTGTFVPPDRLVDTVRLAARLRRSARAAMPRLDGA